MCNWIKILCKVKCWLKCITKNLLKVDEVISRKWAIWVLEGWYTATLWFFISNDDISFQGSSDPQEHWAHLKSNNLQYSMMRRWDAPLIFPQSDGPMISPHPISNHEIFVQLEKKFQLENQKIRIFFFIFPSFSLYFLLPLWWMILFFLRITKFCPRKKSL